MFSFEGDFRTRPSVSLGGASKKVKNTQTFLGLSKVRSQYLWGEGVMSLNKVQVQLHKGANHR